LALPMLRLARNILQRIRPYGWRFAVAVAQVFVMSALELLKLWPLKRIVDHVFTGLPAPWLWLRHLEPWGAPLRWLPDAGPRLRTPRRLQHH
jgi:hypothetical protein